MKLRIALLFGGKSVEHEVSVISGIQAYLSLSREKYDIIPVYLSKNNEMYIGDDIGSIESYRDIKGLLSRSRRVIMVNEDDRVKLVSFPLKRFGKNPEYEIDFVFPVVHGTNVEDGALQGYFKTLGLPFAGCDVTASAVGMDKYIMKMILKEAGVPVLDAGIYTLSDYEDMDLLIKKIEEGFGYPVVVKPVNLGSSVGIGIAHDSPSLADALDDAFKYASRVLVEMAITNLREINCSVLGDENGAEASECEEPLHSEEILSYSDKYERSAKSGASKGMAGVSRRIPADIPKDMREEIRSLAVKAFKALGCCGVSRIDFMIDGDSGQLYFNEINTIPGSLAFYLWEPLGIKYSELLDRIIELALKRARLQNNLTFTFDTNILDSASFGGNKVAAK
ncbi:MAG: D-alanine--D-alanine ligase [Lachnospiraceae bacterium]|nr:D-alanine--D-alanine ligase [Lachnospiraceae bacterium]